MNNSNPSALVALFATREYARRAISRLHDEGFHHTWLGVTEAMQSDGTSAGYGAKTGTRVESDNAIARFFGEGDQTLHDALIKHGVSDEDAARIDKTLPAQSAIVTVDGANHPELAAQIVTECEGEMVSSLGASSLYDSYGDASKRTLPQDRVSELGNYHRGEKLDEARRLQLREERLTVDKRVESAGEATVGTRVVTQQAEMDVPVMHEELYIERRPVTDRAGDVGEIGGDQRVVVPLERERVVVDKRTVATEDVIVGQRRVEETQHVSESLRKEELDVDEDANVATDFESRRATPKNA